jgi:hypothetical protein
VAIHLTPAEMSELTGIRSARIVRMCREMSVPVYEGRVDKTLFLHSLSASGRELPSEAREAVLAA